MTTDYDGLTNYRYSCNISKASFLRAKKAKEKSPARFISTASPGASFGRVGSPKKGPVDCLVCVSNRRTLRYYVFRFASLVSALDRLTASRERRRDSGFMLIETRRADLSSSSRKKTKKSA